MGESRHLNGRLQDRLLNLVLVASSLNRMKEVFASANNIQRCLL